MGLKSFNPYTASRRFMTVLDKSEITKQTPEKGLLEPKKRSGGRNNQGEISAWH
ncbi:MAG: 50S ribosomal protein L2, partial [Acidobacteria bacterium]